MTAILRMTLLSCLALVGGCAPAPEVELSGATMGTRFLIKLVPAPATTVSDTLAQQVRDILERVEDLASTYRPHSELATFNANPSTDWIGVTAEFCQMLEQALHVCRQTDGAFDITVGPLVNLWGFGPDGAVMTPPAAEQIQMARQRVGYQQLETRCAQPAARKQRADLYVDLSGWAKGYAVDQLAALLDDRGQQHYLIEIGGELRARGHNSQNKPWAVAIEQPSSPGRNIDRVVALADQAIATSGDYRNYFDHAGRRFSHTIDPRTGWPADHAAASVSVIDASAATADALATALLVLGPEAGVALADKLEIAAYFLLHGKDGIQSRATTAFKALYES